LPPNRANEETPTARAMGHGRWPVVLAAIGLAALVCGIFWPITRFEFVDFDTNAHVVNNPHVRGLTLENVAYILTSRCVTSVSAKYNRC
jgi:hypothetical protein